MDWKIERGAYGFRLVSADPDLVLPDLAEQPASAPLVRIEWQHASAIYDLEQVNEEGALLSQRGAGLLAVGRDPMLIIGSLPEASSPEAIVHPLSTLPLSVLAHWRGHATLHGGAFEWRDRAWAICGVQMAGKSSALASLAARGVPILADDLVVVDGNRVLAGPDCVDLRPDAAPRFAGARPLGIVAGRERWRLSTPPSSATAPLAGVVLLDWTDDARPRLEPLPTEDRLAFIYGQHYAGVVGPPHPEALMALLEVPMWRFRRARDWATEAAAIDALLGALDAA